MKANTEIKHTFENVHYKLRKAMHVTNGLKIDFGGIDKAMRITAVGIEDQEAIIMPYIINQTLF